jgi:hypothetical protein
MNEYFTCIECGQREHINYLAKRKTMPGDYCQSCAELEQCAACGEMYLTGDVIYKEEVKNYVCIHCKDDYEDQKQYIKPLPTGRQVSSFLPQIRAVP